MITIDKKSLKSCVDTLKGVMPGNYDSMSRIVAVVDYFEALLSAPEPETKEEVKDG